MSKEAGNLVNKRCYTLAANWLRKRRLTRKLNIGQKLAGWVASAAGSLVGVARRRQVVKQGDLWRELFVRFDNAFRRVLIASGCADSQVKAETTACVMNLFSLVNADPNSNCLPQLMWEASASSRAFAGSNRTGLANVFHLRALLDEMPKSPERDDLRLVAFQTREERLARKNDGTTIRDAYLKKQSSVTIGIVQFAEYLYMHRDRVDRLTNGGISVGELTSQPQAFDLIVNSIDKGND